jgi:O-antigen/teichoic acid export membrane protein
MRSESPGAELLSDSQSFLNRARASARRPLHSGLTASVVIQLLNLLTGVLLARVLGPDGRGELAAVILWPTVITAVGSLGVTEAIAFFAARRRAAARVLAATGSVLAGVQGLVLVIAGSGVVALALAGHAGHVTRTGLLYLLNVPLALIALYLMYLFNGLERYDVFNALRALVYVITAVAFVALAATGALTLLTATLSYLAASAVTATAAVVATARIVGGWARFERKVARGLLAFGAKSQISTVSNLLNERLDQLVISVALPPAKLGLYVVAWTLTSAIALLAQTVALAALPAVAARESHTEQVTAARRYVSLTFVGSSAAAVPLLVLTPSLIELFFSAHFSGATDSARLLLIGAVPLGTARVLESVLKSLDRPLEAGLAETLGLALTAVGLAILLPTLGILGAAVTSVGAYSAAMGFALWRVGQALGTPPPRLLFPTREALAAFGSGVAATVGRLRR